MTFNGIRKPYLYMLDGREKAPFAPINRNIVQYPGGYRLKKTERGLLEIKQPVGFIYETDEEALQLKDDLAAWLYTEDWAPLEFDDEPGRIYYSVVQNTITDLSDELGVYKEGIIQFLCLYACGKTHDLAITTNFQTFTILGQDKTPWTSKTTFTAPATQFTLETNHGGKIILNYSFIAGDVLEIDYKKRKITLNNNDLAVALSIQSVWFELEPGQVQIKASHPTTLTYTERYY